MCPKSIGEKASIAIGMAAIRSLAILSTRCPFYSYLLHHDGCLKPARLPATSMQTLQFFFGVSGIIWRVLAHSLAYLRPGFHPWDYDNRAKMLAWLDAHQSQFRDINSR